MSPARIVMFLLFLAFLVIGRGMTDATRVAAAQPLVGPPPTTSVSMPLLDIQRNTIDPDKDLDVDQPKTDLFGNEVDDAIGDYRVDGKGDIYENHSPDTEVSRLRPAIG
jgi:hypothetical protein